MTRDVPMGCEALGPAFGLGSQCLTRRLHGSGHIHDTVFAAYQTDRGLAQVVHQRINCSVFREPTQVMHNIVHVTQALAKIQRHHHPHDWTRRVLRVVHTLDGQSVFRDPYDQLWRTYHYIPDSLAYDQVHSAAQAEAAAFAFGEFTQALARYDGPALHETIAGFHDTPARWEALLRAVREDRVQRVQHVAAELDALANVAALRWVLAQPLAAGDLPRRVVHNDTKLNNILFDAQRHEALCVVDLDTLMPGTPLFDFGDLVRSSTSNVAEDTRDVDDARINESIFAGLARGWLRACAPTMNETERGLMVRSAQVLTFEVAVRFLTDYLAGDLYFRVAHTHHNLQRCRTQLALLAAMLRQETRLEAIVMQVDREQNQLR